MKIYRSNCVLIWENLNDASTIPKDSIAIGSELYPNNNLSWPDKSEKNRNLTSVKVVDPLKTYIADIRNGSETKKDAPVTTDLIG